MFLSSASLCCLLLLGVVCSQTTAYSEPAIDQAEVAAPRHYDNPITKATVQQSCCGCCPNYPSTNCVYCFWCPPCWQ